MVSKHREKCENLERCKMFKKYVQEIEPIDNLEDWFTLIACIMGTVETIYSKNSTKYEFFQQLLNPPTHHSLNNCKKSAVTQLNSIIYELKTIGVPNSTSHSPVFHNEVTQNVAQTVNVEVVSVLENQIPPITVNEIKEIIGGKGTPEEKKNKIFETVKSTGENILAKTISELMWKYFGGQ